MVGRSIQSFNNSNLKNIKKNPAAAAHGGKEYIPPVGRGVTSAAR
jgi:hypothetical protein